MQLTLTTLLLLSPILLSTAVEAVCAPHPHGPRRHHHTAKKNHSRTSITLSSSPKSLKGVTSAQIVSVQHSSSSAVKVNGTESITTTTRAWSSRKSPAASSSSKIPLSSAAPASPSPSKSSSNGHGGCKVHANGICIGMVPDDGSGGSGSVSTTIQSLNSALGSDFSHAGYYAQVSSGGSTFDGGQLTAKMNEIVSSGAVFQPAVMPTGGWNGFTSDNNYQAVAVCKVMKQFTDQGVEVWLRFAHEMNWYQSDGTYPGGVADFQEGWATVAAACRQIAPAVKMYWTPNIGSSDQYAQYWPAKAGDVDYVGVDWYPSTSDVYSGSFAKQLQSFHDTYASSSVKMAQGETGLGQSASVQERLAWLQEITSSNTASKMPNFVAVSWFNYMKGYDFRILGDGVDDAQTISYLKN